MSWLRLLTYFDTFKDLLRDMFFTQIGLMNITYLVTGGFNLYLALQLRNKSKFGVYRVFYGYAGYFFFLGITQDLYRFPVLRKYLLVHVRTFLLAQYTVIFLSLVAINVVILGFLYEYIVTRKDYDL